jgi:hypothetical protein
MRVVSLPNFLEWLRSGVSIGEFRAELRLYWKEALREALAMKESGNSAAVLRLNPLYQSLTSDEREMADLVLREWISSDDGDERWAARSVIWDFHITSAVPDLMRYRDRLVASGDRLERNEADLIRRLLERLESGLQK